MDRLSLVLLLAVLAASVVAFTADFAVLPVALGVGAALVAVVGLGSLFVIGVIQERREGTSVARSFGRALRGVLRMFFDLF